MINYYNSINWKKDKENNSERTCKTAGLKKKASREQNILGTREETHNLSKVRGLWRSRLLLNFVLGYPGYQRFFSRAAGIFGFGRRADTSSAVGRSHERRQKPETALEKSLAPRVVLGSIMFCFPLIIIHYYSKKGKRNGKERLTKIILSALFSEHFLWLPFCRRNCFESFSDYFLYFYDRTELKKLASYSLIFKNLLG